MFAMISAFRTLVGSVTSDRRGVTAAEYAILAVGIVIVVGGAILAFDLNNPLLIAGNVITSSQASLASGAR